jgi:hypothetical protein
MDLSSKQVPGPDPILLSMIEHGKRDALTWATATGLTAYLAGASFIPASPQDRPQDDPPEGSSDMPESSDNQASKTDVMSEDTSDRVGKADSEEQSVHVEVSGYQSKKCSAFSWDAEEKAFTTHIVLEAHDSSMQLKEETGAKLTKNSTSSTQDERHVLRIRIKGQTDLNDTLVTIDLPRI